MAPSHNLPDGPRSGEHDPETHLIPLAISAALGSGPALQIYSTDYATHDGTCIRDYVHVSDLAAHVASLRALLDDQFQAFTAVNLGTGNGYSVQDVLRHIEEITGRRVPRIVSARREGDPPVLVAQSSGRSILDWSSAYLQLRDMIESACVWHMGQHSRRTRDAAVA